jgi:hypothetical protein
MSAIRKQRKLKTFEQEKLELQRMFARISGDDWPWEESMATGGWSLQETPTDIWGRVLPLPGLE